LEKRQQLLEGFGKFRSSAAIDLTENPFERIRLQDIQNAKEAYNQFSPLGGSYADQAAELERQKSAKEFQAELKNQIENVRSVASDVSDNPFVQLFDNARTSMDKARESTKWLTKDVQNLVLEATRGSNVASLFNLRVDTVLDSLSLRQKASSILNPNRDFSAADATRDQYYAIQNANVDAATKARRSAEIFSGSDPKNFPNELRGIAYETLNKEAERREGLEKEALGYQKSIDQNVSNILAKMSQEKGIQTDSFQNQNRQFKSPRDIEKALQFAYNKGDDTTEFRKYKTVQEYSYDLVNNKIGSLLKTNYLEQSENSLKSIGFIDHVQGSPIDRLTSRIESLEKTLREFGGNIGSNEVDIRIRNESDHQVRSSMRASPRDTAKMYGR
jgi:hypothetical protein